MKGLNFGLIVFSSMGIVIPIQALDTLRAELSEPPAVYQDINDWQWFSMKDYIDWSLEASSFLSPQGENTYGPSLMTDGLVRTAWVEGRDDYGEGEFVIFRFDFTKRPEVLPDSLMFIGFWVMNGYCKDEKTWKANPRVKTLKLCYNGEPIFIIALHDVRYLQEVNFPELMWVKPNDSMRVEILEVYPGTKYSDTAISELMPRTGQM